MSHHVAILRAFTEWLKEYSGSDSTVKALSTYVRRDEWWPVTGNTQWVYDYLNGVTHPDGIAYGPGIAPFDTAWTEWKTTLSGAELAKANQAEL